MQEFRVTQTLPGLSITLVLLLIAHIRHVLHLHVVRKLKPVLFLPIRIMFLMVLLHPALAEKPRMVEE